MSQDALWTPDQAAYVRTTMDEIRLRPHNGNVAVGSFSGCGGSTLGLKMAGWEVPVAIEFGAAAAETYRANAPETEVIEEDIRNVTPEHVLQMLGMERGELDLFEGSPPCASFSAAGNRERAWGEEKQYSDVGKQRTDDLFWEWMRLLDGLHPRAFIAENVPGMLMGNALEEYAWKVTKELGQLGYAVNAKVMDSQNFGVPQERKRLIFLGIRRDVMPEGIPEHPGATVAEPVTLKQALASVEYEKEDGPVVAASSMEKYAVGRSWHAITEARAQNRPVDFRYLPCQRCGKPFHVEHEILKTTQEGVVTKAKCADGAPAEILKEYFMLVVPELDQPCPTVTATGAQAGAASVCHPTECRKFIPRELLAIGGFPPDFVLTGTREQQCERIGRTVTPPLYEAMGKRIAEYLDA